MKHPFSRLFGFGEKKRIELEDESHEEILKRNEEIQQIPINKIIPNRYQPRTVFDDEQIEELAITIRTHGMIQPIVVEK